MGYDYTTYVGPYITYEMPKKESTKSWRACPSKICSGPTIISDEDEFCSKCSCKIKTLTSSTDVDAFCIYDDFLYPFEESLHLAGEYVENVLLPNRHIPGEHDFHDANLGEYKLDKVKDLKYFKEDYVDEIEELKSKLKNVKIKWGVINYAI